MHADSGQFFGRAGNRCGVGANGFERLLQVGLQHLNGLGHFAYFVIQVCVFNARVEFGVSHFKNSILQACKRPLDGLQNDINNEARKENRSTKQEHHEKLHLA